MALDKKQTWKALTEPLPSCDTCGHFGIDQSCAVASGISCKSTVSNGRRMSGERYDQYKTKNMWIERNE